ncbi:hypothetical protein [Mucilaginibacter glaciei]|nr:hypothetical protein [Mucilaginibacter glaciei]
MAYHVKILGNGVPLTVPLPVPFFEKVFRSVPFLAERNTANGM